MSKQRESADFMSRAVAMAKELGLDLEHAKRPGMSMMTVFFDPDAELIKWLGEYQGKRLIVDVGCGTGTVIKRLYVAGYKRVCGIEPHWDYQESLNWRNNHEDILQVMSYFIEEPTAASMIKAENVLFLVCRPSHGGWPQYLAEQLHPTSEILLIQKEESFERHHDMGKFHKYMRPVDFTGSSKENERIWSFKKEDGKRP